MILRPYQQQAVNKLLWSQQLEGADLCVLPTGAGKSVVISDLTHKIGKPMLILQPTKEILEQNLEKLKAVVPASEIGIYSASMNQKFINTFTFATIQSIYKKPELFKDFNQVIIDECHLVNPKNLGGMYSQFFAAIGSPKIFGFTATPYRMATMYERDENGGLWAHITTKLINRLKERFWFRIIYNVNIQELIDADFLVPLKYIDKTIIDHAEIPTNVSGSDFDLKAYEEKIRTKQDEILEAVCFGRELGKHVLVFCSSVEQAEWLSEIVPDGKVVTAKTPKREREKIIADFKSGRLKVVFNVGVLTTGFDHPALDVIVLLRPTQSIGLYYQMLGRGVRRFEGKENCKVIDITGTVKKMGRVETIRIEKRDDGWALASEVCDQWHYKPLYSHEIKREPNIDDDIPF